MSQEEFSEAEHAQRMQEEFDRLNNIAKSNGSINGGNTARRRQAISALRTHLDAIEFGLIELEHDE